jgi:hypothetical protein
MKRRRTFLLDQCLVEEIDRVRVGLDLNRTQYLRRALRAAIRTDRRTLLRRETEVLAGPDHFRMRTETHGA